MASSYGDQDDVHARLLPYFQSLEVAGEYDDCSRPASSIWEENNIPDNRDRLNLLEDNDLMRLSGDVSSKSGSEDGNFRRSGRSNSMPSYSRELLDEASEKDSSEHQRASRVVSSVAKSLAKKRQLAAMAAWQKSGQHPAPRLLISRKRYARGSRGSGSQASPSPSKNAAEVIAKLSSPTLPQVILDKLQEQGRTGRLDGKDKRTAKLIRWKLKQVALRQQQSDRQPARGWAMLQQLIRGSSEEYQSAAAAGSVGGELDSIDALESTAAEIWNSAGEIYGLIDDDCVGALLATLRPLPRHVVVQLSHPLTRLNLLQHSLAAKKVEIARALVQLCGRDLVIASNFVGSGATDEIETCLHRAVALGDLPLVKAVLGTLDGESRSEYLAAETVVVINTGGMNDKPAHQPKVDDNSLVVAQERMKGSVLHLASVHGHLDIVSHLVKYELVPVDVNSNTRATPICLAAACNHLPVVEFLDEAGADLEVVDATRRTFLHYAIMSGNDLMVARAVQRFGKLAKYMDMCRAENPLVMAAWHGRASVVRTLLQNPELATLSNLPTLHHGNVALHVVCSRCGAEATDIVSQLLAAGARVDVRNREGKTPLMCAAEAGAVDTIVLLAERMTHPKARYFRALHDNGKSVWDYAIAASQNDSLIALLEVARFCCQTDSDAHEKPECAAAGDCSRQALHEFVRMPAELGGTTPLHAAAAKGDLGKLRIMLKYSFPPEKTVDSRGDTFLHTAAREGQLKVISALASRPLFVNQQNASGDSVMLVACSAGQQACASALLPKADMSLMNKRSRTAVHELCGLPDVPYGLLRDVVRRTIDVSWDMLAHKDDTGRTALHILAVHTNLVDRERIFKLFHQSFASSPICNSVRHGGYTPLHDALHQRCVDNSISLLNTFGTSLHVNAEDDQGRTPMHIAVKKCLVDAVLPLIQSGGDLLVTDKKGDTPLHVLVNCANETPKLANEYIKLLYEIIDCAVIWFCKLKDIVPIPKKGVDEHKYKQYLKSSVTLLLTAVYNKRDMNVLMWATSKCGGCKELLGALLTVPDVFFLRRVGNRMPQSEDENHFYYDVTDLVPDTVVPLKQAALLDSGITPQDALLEASPYAGRPVTGMMTEAYSAMASDAAWQTAYNAKSALVKIIRPKYPKRSSLFAPKRSIVEIIIGGRESYSEHRWQLLDVTPIREITMDYWGPYKYIYAVLMIVHVAYMAVFSELALHMTASAELACKYPGNASSPAIEHATRYPPDAITYSLLLVWPCILIVADLLYCLLYLQRQCKACFARRISARSLFRAPFRHLEIMYVACYWIFGIIFSWLAVAWFVLYAIGDCHQDYVLSIVMISGWLYTINFTQGIRSVHHFSLVLQRIVLKDFLKFSFVFASLIVGYSYAFQVLTLSIPSLRKEYPELGHTFFTAFNWLIGMDEFYKVSKQEFSDQGKHVGFLMATFVSYILLLNIVLVNLLVAIMNDSYSSIYQRHQLVWRIDSLKHALDIENHFPFIGNLLRKLRRNPIIKDTFSQHTRFYLKVALPKEVASSEADTESSSLSAIGARLDSLAASADRLEQTASELKEKLELLSSSEWKLRQSPPSSPTIYSPDDFDAKKISDYVKWHILPELTRKVKRAI